jgi:hypothetical protein
MDRKKIYKRLKNGKGIEVFYSNSDSDNYTIRIDLKEGKLQLHTFCFVGNDVLDETNYKDEILIIFDSVDSLFVFLDKEFPGFIILDK